MVAKYNHPRPSLSPGTSRRRATRGNDPVDPPTSPLVYVVGTTWRLTVEHVRDRWCDVDLEQRTARPSRRYSSVNSRRRSPLTITRSAVSHPGRQPWASPTRRGLRARGRGHRRGLDSHPGSLRRSIVARAFHSPPDTAPAPGTRYDQSVAVFFPVPDASARRTASVAVVAQSEGPSTEEGRPCLPSSE